MHWQLQVPDLCVVRGVVDSLVRARPNLFALPNCMRAIILSIYRLLLLHISVTDDDKSSVLSVINTTTSMLFGPSLYLDFGECCSKEENLLLFKKNRFIVRWGVALCQTYATVILPYTEFYLGLQYM